MAALLAATSPATMDSLRKAFMPFDYLPVVADQIKPSLKAMLQAVLAFAQSRARPA